MKPSSDEIYFDPASTVDPAGRVFHYQGKIYRAIPKAYSEIYERFLKSPFAEAAFKAGLIETKIGDFSLENYGLVIEHKKIPHLSAWPEWCSNMIKDATKTVVTLNIELAKNGFITKDIQPGNVQFFDGRPEWIDFSSVIPLESTDGFRFKEFRYHSVLPLWLISKGFRELGKEMYAEFGIGYFKRKFSYKYLNIFPPRYALIWKRTSRISLTRALSDLLEYVDSLKVVPKRGTWTDYGQGGMPPVSDPNAFGEKAKRVHRILSEVPKGTLLDIACNKGWYSELAAQLGHDVVAFDTDDASICELYRRVKEKNLKILPLVLDFLYPTPPFSIGLSRRSAIERLRCDTVLAISIVHHLVFKHQLFFEPITSQLSAYTGTRAIVEFVPPNDEHVKHWYNDNYRWYSLDNFVTALKEEFKTVEIYDSWPEPRKLLLCSK